MNDTRISLTPGAGQGLGKILFSKLLARPDFVDDLAAALHDGLQATTPRRWDKDTEGWISDPDYRVRTQTAFGIMAQAEGDPIKRIVHSAVGPMVGDSMEALVTACENPAILAAVRRAVEKAEATGGRKRLVQTAAPVDGEPASTT